MSDQTISSQLSESAAGNVVVEQVYGLLAGNPLGDEEWKQAPELGIFEPLQTRLKAIRDAAGSGVPLQHSIEELRKELIGNDAETTASFIAGDEFSDKVFVPVSGSKLPSSNENGLSVSVGNGERSQFRIHFDDSVNSNVLHSHFLARVSFKSSEEAFIAFRWVHGNDPEEVMVRFRFSELIAGRAIPVPMDINNTFVLVTLSRHNGQDIILINGIPVYWNDVVSSDPSGVVLDVIGPGSGSVDMEVYFVHVTSGTFGPYTESGYYNAFVARFFGGLVDVNSLDQVSLWLHGLAGCPYLLEANLGKNILKMNTDQSTGYRNYLEALVLDKVPEDDGPSIAKLLADRVPKPALVVDRISVELASNPSKHASLRYLFGSRPKNNLLLSQISLNGYTGDTIGIIGKNGAGKTTFLKTLVAAMPLSAGKISIGTSPMLLRPGAGMQGELSGRENIYKTGLYMGILPREMDDLAQDIISFAELEDHIDRPFRYYSDGMRARLIFALATAIPREILLFDELLSAGDIGFQKKAMKRLDSFLENAKLVLVVQHTFDFVLSRCTKCLLLDHGKPIYFGDPRIATEMYKEML